MTTPTHSAFTVTVAFQGIHYDVKITPTLNGEPVEWIQDRVDQWVSAEKTQRLFSQKIVEMLEDKTFLDNYSIANHGLITSGSEKGFTFEKDSAVIIKPVQALWDDFIDCLQDPASRLKVKDPVVSNMDDVPGSGVGFELQFSPDAYVNLQPEQQKQVRSELFLKSFDRHFKGEVEIDRDAYTDAEKACIKVLLDKNKSKPIQSLQDLILALWTSKALPRVEKGQLSIHFLRLSEAMKEAAARAEAESEDLGVTGAK
jgi:hypothetical protein